MPTELEMIEAQRQHIEDFSKWRLDPEEILAILERNFRGEIWDPVGKKWVKKGKVLMNDEGISMVISIAATRINKVTMLTNFSEEQIFMQMRFFEIQLVGIIFSKMADFNIQSLSDADHIIDSVVSLTFAAYKKSEDAGERESLDRGGDQTIRHINYGEGGSRRGVMPRIFGRKQQEEGYR